MNHHVMYGSPREKSYVSSRGSHHQTLGGQRPFAAGCVGGRPYMTRRAGPVSGAPFGFGVWGLVFGVQDLGFRVWGLGFGV